MEIRIECSGYSIATDWYEGLNTSKILIVLPGYSSSKARQAVHAKAMVEATGTCALVVDFSGHGNSPFDLAETRPAQHLLELVYVFDWLKDQYPDAVISVSGSSYGGFLATHLTQYRQFTNLILRAPAMYKPEAFYDLWSVRIDNEDEYARALRKYREDTVALARHPLLKNAVFTGAGLVVVHENDEIVPRQTTSAYIQAFSSDTILAKGFTHTIDANNLGPDRLQQYQADIAKWLNSHSS